MELLEEVNRLKEENEAMVKKIKYSEIEADRIDSMIDKLKDVVQKL